MNFIKSTLPALALLFHGSEAKSENQETKQKKNVLFIIVDDLRTELNCYGVNYMHTPNIDKLASEGILFRQAFCNIPVSGASRASLMTGLRPTQNRWKDVDAKIDKEAPGIETLPKYFKNNGYVTISNSKVIHGAKDAADSWNEVWKPKGKSKSWRDYLGDENLSTEMERRGPLAYEALDVKDNEYFDGKTAEKTIKDLKRLKKDGNPFFLSVGILKPHLPFNAPKKYWDMYPVESISLPENFFFNREGFPDEAFHTAVELRYYKNIPVKEDVGPDEAKNLIRGYRACVSYADAQVGKILEELKRLDLDKNTVVVLIGDHGWSLGDHNQWCKHSNFNVVNHAPMIFSIPGMPANKKVDKIVEFVDLYPTICDAVGLKTPAHVEGKSMLNLIKADDKNWKDCAIVKWHSGVTYMGQKHHYTEWRDKGDVFNTNMLFDVQKDYNENVNLAQKKENAELVEKLTKEIFDRRGKDFKSNIK